MQTMPNALGHHAQTLAAPGCKKALETEHPHTAQGVGQPPQHEQTVADAAIVKQRLAAQMTFATGLLAVQVLVQMLSSGLVCMDMQASRLMTDLMLAGHPFEAPVLTEAGIHIGPYLASTSRALLPRQEQSAAWRQTFPAGPRWLRIHLCCISCGIRLCLMAFARKKSP